MEFSELEIYDFLGFRFYYGLSQRAYILVETPTAFIDLGSGATYSREKIHSLLRLTSPGLHAIHDHLEVRLDKHRVDQFISKFPAYAWALRDQLEKMTIYSSNLLFHLEGLLGKLDEILSYYSTTDYHQTKEEKKHFVRRIIANFDRYIQLDELVLNWLNVIDCLCQYQSSAAILVVNTWRSFLLIKNYQGSSYPQFYYPFSRELFRQFQHADDLELLNLDESTIPVLLNPAKIRVSESKLVSSDPVRYL